VISSAASAASQDTSAATAWQPSSATHAVAGGTCRMSAHQPGYSIGGSAGSESHWSGYAIKGSAGYHD